MVGNPGIEGVPAVCEVPLKSGFVLLGPFAAENVRLRSAPAAWRGRLRGLDPFLRVVGAVRGPGHVGPGHVLDLLHPCALVRQAAIGALELSRGEGVRVFAKAPAHCGPQAINVPPGKTARPQ